MKEFALPCSVEQIDVTEAIECGLLIDWVRGTMSDGRVITLDCGASVGGHWLVFKVEEPKDESPNFYRIDVRYLVRDVVALDEELRRNDEKQ